MNDIQIFENAEFGKVRTVEIDGKPYFVANDVAKALGYVETAKAVRTHCKGVSEMDIPTNGGIQRMKVISEGDIYRLIIRSNLPSAERFETWVFDEVLPTIRKTGSYALPQTYAEALRALADKAEEAERLALENKEMQPKAEFFDAVADSKTALPMDQVAKILEVKGYGRNKLFEFLRNNGVLQKDNTPYQKFIDAGWFRRVEQHYQKGYEPCVSIKTLF